MLLIQRSDVERCCPMPDAVAAVARGFAALSAGQATAPLRAAIPLPEHDGVTLVMPGHVAPDHALSIKVVSVHDGNPAQGFPRIHATVLVVDPATGRARALLEGASLTALRTGAASGVATQHLARPDATTLAMLGAGVQARTQVLAVLAVRPIARVLVYDPDAARLKAFVAAMGTECGAEVDVRAATSANAAVAEADVVCAATTSATPVFDGTALRPGTHVNGVGSFTPAMRELDAQTLRRAAKVVVDQREAALAEAGELIAGLADGTLSAAGIHAELGEIVAGTRPGRETSDEITVFKSVGNAVQDAAVATVVVDRAEREGIGTMVELD